MAAEENIDDLLAIVAEIGDFIWDFVQESDRALVVLGGARIDVALERLLKAVMSHHGGGSDNLFDPDRPLGTFSAKIATAYRLNLIDDKLEHVLQMIRKIRNDFAHSIDKMTLSDSQHKSRIIEIGKQTRKMLNNDGQPMHQLLLDDSFGKGKPEPIREFCVSMTLILATIERAAYRAEPFHPKFPASINSFQ